MIPVLPALVGSLTTSPHLQAYWFGALATTYGIMQFFCTPLLGALSDRYGRRPVLLLSIFGLGMSYIVTAFAQSLILLLMARLVSGATGATFRWLMPMLPISLTQRTRQSLWCGRCSVWCWFYFWPDDWWYMLGAADLRLPFMVAAGFVIFAIFVWLFCFTRITPPRKTRTIDMLNELTLLAH
jgi:DHA1 family tetracycline resistance protein-like MFS transporter